MSTLLNPIAQDSNETRQPVPATLRYACFGAFLADLERGELFKNGQQVKVQSKLFQALTLLLSRAGEVVTREEVRGHLWPDTFLSNLDANVNTTINKLRLVLGDSAESPVYIETIPRRGYSFVAEIVWSEFLSAAAIEAAKKTLPTGTPGEARWKVWSDKRMFARMASLLFGGMILGALLAFVWFFSQAKNRHTSHAALNDHVIHRGDLEQLNCSAAAEQPQA